MAATELPPLSFDDGGLRIVLPSQEQESKPTRPHAELEGAGSSVGSSSHRPAAESQRPSNIPTHPIPSFQEAFAESLEEVTTAGGVHKPKLRGLDARARRELLLSQGRQDDPFDVKWRYRAGQNQHEIIKLLAQISFGVYLMLNGMANSTAQVITILQGHIDEVDEFLEVALEDQDQAIEDLKKRINHLKLPMANMEVFEQLLTDRKFRNEILDGNEKIDAILDRTNVAVRQWDDDIESGLRSSAVFAKWLQEQDTGDWHVEHPELVDVFDAMKGNTDGWITAFEDMNNKAQDINDLIVTLMNIVTEMEAKAGEVSRKFPESAQTYSSTPSNSLQPTTGQSQSLSPVPTVTSNPHSSTGSSTSAQNPFLDPIKVDDDDDDDSFFPLPGLLPLLPPSRATSRQQPSPVPTQTTNKASEPTEPTLVENEVSTFTSPAPTPAPASASTSAATEEPKPEEQEEEEDDDGKVDEGDVNPKPDRASRSSTYLLLPKTYVPPPPVPPAPRASSASDASDSIKSPTFQAMESPATETVTSEKSPFDDTASTVASPTTDVRAPTASPIPKSASPAPSSSASQTSSRVTPAAASVRSVQLGVTQAVSIQRAIPVVLTDSQSSGVGMEQSLALRERSSNPPDAIRIPPRSVPQSPMNGLSPNYAGARTASATMYNSSRMSDGDGHATLRVAADSPELVSPNGQHQLVPSPHSEHNYYRPVQASPHSPLQQRPSTAAPSNHGTAERPAMYRNQPSQLGAMSVISNSTVGTSYDDQFSPRADSRTSERQLKKKKSTFGWLKKAFTMDEDERAAFESRRGMQNQPAYYDPNQPRFLDGRRIR